MEPEAIQCYNACTRVAYVYEARGLACAIRVPHLYCQPRWATVQSVLCCGMIGLNFISNTRANRRRWERKSTDLSTIISLGQSASLIQMHLRPQCAFRKGRTDRGSASTRASLYSLPSVSAGVPPSAALGRRGVDRPARAHVLAQPRSATPLPGPGSQFRLLVVLPTFPSIGSPSNC